MQKHLLIVITSPPIGHSLTSWNRSRRKQLERGSWPRLWRRRLPKTGRRGRESMTGNRVLVCNVWVCVRVCVLLISVAFC